MLNDKREPTPRSRASGERHRAQIWHLYEKQGMRGRAIARQLDLTEGYVYRVIREGLAQQEASA